MWLFRSRLDLNLIIFSPIFLSTLRFSYVAKKIYLLFACNSFFGSLLLYVGMYLKKKKKKSKLPIEIELYFFRVVRDQSPLKFVGHIIVFYDE
jgi:hypothetical protein